MLDLYKIVPKLDDIISQLQQDRETTKEALERINEAFQDALETPQKLEDLLEPYFPKKQTSTPLLARPLEPLDTAIAVSERKPNVEVLATDGSQSSSPYIGLDCFLVNIGVVGLRLGDDAGYIQESYPQVIAYSPAANSGVTRPEDEMRQTRDKLELMELAKLAEESKRDRFTLALADNGLTYWYYMQKYKGKEESPTEKTLYAMIETLACFRKKEVALAGYISGSSNKELANSLNLFQSGEPQVASIPDRIIWERKLRAGERGPLMESNSEVIGKYPEDDKPLFFPLHVGTEVGKVEIPHWCRPHVNDIAAVIYDQAVKGNGYPQILDEAHQTAVVTFREADSLWDLIAQQAEKQGIILTERAKRVSKRISGY